MVLSSLGRQKMPINPRSFLIFGIENSTIADNDLRIKLEAI